MPKYHVTVTVEYEINADSAQYAKNKAYHMQTGGHPYGVMQFGLVDYDVTQIDEGESHDHD